MISEEADVRPGGKAASDCEVADPAAKAQLKSCCCDGGRVGSVRLLRRCLRLRNTAHGGERVGRRWLRGGDNRCKSSSVQLLQTD